MHVVYYNSSNTTTAPPTTNRYTMHDPTEISTPLPATVHNIISEIKQVQSIHCNPHGLQRIAHSTMNTQHTVRMKRVHRFHTIGRCASCNVCSPDTTSDTCIREEQFTPHGPHRSSSAQAKVNMRTYNRRTCALQVQATTYVRVA